MPLVGGGGAGNTAGSNPAGIGTSLNYIGDHAYAYSGAVAVTNSEKTLLSFETGNSLFVGTWTGHFNQAIDAAIEMDDYRFVLYLNGIQIMELTATDSGSQNRNNNRELIIPPYTSVIVSCQNYNGSTTNDMGATIVGRVYYV